MPRLRRRLSSWSSRSHQALKKRWISRGDFALHLTEMSAKQTPPILKMDTLFVAFLQAF